MLNKDWFRWNKGRGLMQVLPLNMVNMLQMVIDDEVMTRSIGSKFAKVQIDGKWKHGKICQRGVLDFFVQNIHK
jgi:hypothetical protein